MALILNVRSIDRNRTRIASPCPLGMTIPLEISTRLGPSGCRSGAVRLPCVFLVPGLPFSLGGNGVVFTLMPNGQISRFRGMGPVDIMRLSSRNDQVSCGNISQLP